MKNNFTNFICYVISSQPSVPDDVDERYHDFVVEDFEIQPPPYNYGRSSNTHSYSNAVTST